MVFSRFLSTTVFIPAENTRHSEKTGQNSVVEQCSVRTGMAGEAWQVVMASVIEQCSMRMAICGGWKKGRK
jgi:hypothetical protein